MALSEGDDVYNAVIKHRWNLGNTLKTNQTCVVIHVLYKQLHFIQFQQLSFAAWSKYLEFNHEKQLAFCTLSIGNSALLLFTFTETNRRSQNVSLVKLGF